MRIGLDVDDVLFNWTRHAHAAAERAGITNGKQITQWSFYKDYECTPELLWQVLYEAYAEGMLLNPPYPEVRAILTALRDDLGHSVHLVTARGYEPRYGGMVREHTSRWLETYELPFDSLTFTKHKADVRTDMFLDDSIKNVKDLKLNGVDAYLADQPHNRSNTDLLRVADLTEFYGLVQCRTTARSLAKV